MTSVAARLDRLPITRSHCVFAMVVGIGVFFDLFDVFLSGVLSTALTRSFNVDRAVLPVILGSGFLGMFFGAVCFGTLADRYGRRTAYLINLGIYSVFTLLGAFSVNATMLILTRFVAGTGIGAELPLTDAYLGELLPAGARGRLTAWAYTVGFLGVPAVGLLARVLVPLRPLGLDGWRWLFVAGSLGGAITWMLRRRLPESPRWLDATGRTDQAVQIVERLEQEAVSVCGVLPPPGPEDGASAERVNFRMLFSPAYRQRTLMLWVFQFFQTVGYYGFGTLVPLVLAAKGISVVTSLTYTSLAFVGYPVGSALSIPIVERMDRRWLIAGSAGLMAVFGLALGYSSTPAAIVGFGFAYTSVSNLFSNGLHIFQAEIFPTAIRATAAGSAYGLSRLSSALMPFVLLPVLNRYGAGMMFAAIAAAMTIVIVDIAAFAPSTTGRTLEGISPP